MSYLQLLPAVDITEGRAVQLAQGVAGSERAYGDPVAAALRWQDAGAEWLHLVDLDAAFGRGSNRELQAEIVGALDIQVEMSGGIRDDESLAAALATGCRRVNIGTAALEQPEWCARVIAEHGDRIADRPRRPRPHARRARLDPRGRRPLRGAGPPRRRGLRPLRRHRRQQGRHARRARTSQLLRDVCAATDRPVIASGGVTELADIEALMALVPDGVEGAIAGTALYEGRFTLEDALALTLPEGRR